MQWAPLSHMWQGHTMALFYWLPQSSAPVTEQTNAFAIFSQMNPVSSTKRQPTQLRPEHCVEMYYAAVPVTSKDAMR